jgi:two-component system, NtrC family, response regulator AtoC
MHAALALTRRGGCPVSPFSGTLMGVPSLPSLLLLDEHNLVSARMERDLALKYAVLRVARGQLSETSDTDVVVVSCANARTLRVDDFPPDVPRVIVVGALPSIADVVAAIHAGAQDLVSAEDGRALLAAVDAAVERRRLEAELLRLAEAPTAPDIIPQILGESPVMVKLRARIARVAVSDITVLVAGPSGSGKDLVARALHDAGPRRPGPFVAVACGAIPRHLAESEFFGHTRGAFSGAVQDRDGLLLQASGGTLFLDDIAEMPLELQAKLLRALQERSVRPLGQGREIPFDARVVAATSRDLEHEVRAGRFREDLYFRLNVITVRTPALSERGHDVLLLAQYFIRRASTVERPLLGLTPGAARALMAHDWPGNVRELEHCITAAVTAATADHVGTADLPAPLGQRKVLPSPESLKSLEVVERAHILSTLSAVDGNRALASRILKLDRKTLYRKLKSYAGSDPPPRTREDSVPG